MTRSVSRSWKSYLFLFPALLVYTAFVIIPSFRSIYISFFNWNGISEERTFVGVTNFYNLFFKDSVFWVALKNNVVWTMLALTFTCGIGLVIALLLNGNFRGKVLFRSVFYFPYLLSGIIVALIWGWIYHPMLGALKQFFLLLGWENVSTAWLGKPQSAIFAVFVAFAWHVVGFQMILFLAGLQTIPPEPYESATLDGANWFQMLWRITLPLLRETYIIVIATTIIGSFKIYDIVVGMTKGGPAYATIVLALWMYDKTFYYYNAGEGATVAVVLTAVIAAIAIPYIRFMLKREYY